MVFLLHSHFGNKTIFQPHGVNTCTAAAEQWLWISTKLLFSLNKGNQITNQCHFFIVAQMICIYHLDQTFIAPGTVSVWKQGEVTALGWRCLCGHCHRPNRLWFIFTDTWLLCHRTTSPHKDTSTTSTGTLLNILTDKCLPPVSNIRVELCIKVIFMSRSDTFYLSEGQVLF